MPVIGDSMIVYALVARGITVLAEYTHHSTSGNFQTVTRKIMTQIPDSDGKNTYAYDGYSFHCIVENGITYLW